jgi:hypothetical protein
VGFRAGFTLYMVTIIEIYSVKPVLHTEAHPADEPVARRERGVEETPRHLADRVGLGRIVVS